MNELQALHTLHHSPPFLLPLPFPPMLLLFTQDIQEYLIYSSKILERDLKIQNK